VRRGVHADEGDRRRAHAGRPREEEVERARAYAAGRRVLAFENTNAVARHGAAKSILFGESIDPDDSIAALDAGHVRGRREVARGIDPTTLAGGVRRPAPRRSEFEV
jgi:hypothetical protein